MHKAFIQSGIICRFFSNIKEMRTVGLIVIGNEILNGQVSDENSVYLSKSLPILGLKLKKVSVIPDEIEIISEEVLLFSKTYDHVITSGGIGPTHDDVTFEAVASAFKESVYQHPELTKKLTEFFELNKNNGLSDPKLRLARVPESSKLTYGRDVVTGLRIPYPVIAAYNVIMLPGIPTLFKKGFDIIKESLNNSNGKLYTDAIYFSIEESKLTNDLNIVVKEFDQRVLFGSYPVLNNNFYKVKITMESNNDKEIESASSRLKSLIGEENISKYNPMYIENASSIVYKLSEKDTTLGIKVKAALLTIEESFQRYRPNELVIAFTGGKDCTVLLHLIYSYLNKRSNPPKVKLLFVRTHPSFAEVEDFIKRSLYNYEIVPPKSNFLEYNGPMKDSMWQLKKDHSEIKAVFMGTRKTDPNGNTKSFNQTTAGWPEYCLINPILDWSYHEVWKFLLDMSVPYCTLYDKGYTSLGGIDNTLPNSKLLYVDKDGKSKYKPAHFLEDETLERIGR